MLPMIQAPEENPQVASSSLSPRWPQAVRPDCLHYTRTGFCDYGVNCRFNHPPNKLVDSACAIRKKEEYPERPGETECTYYLKTGTCKFGTSCKYHHPKEKAGILGKAFINHAGYPIRLGEKDCEYYMHTGRCKFGTTCKFNHPQSASLSCPMDFYGPSIYTSTSAMPMSSRPTFPSWSLTRTSLSDLPLQRLCSSMLIPPESFLPMSGWTHYQGSPRAMMPVPPLELKQQVHTGTSIYGTSVSQNLYVPYNPYVAGNAAASFCYSFAMSKDSFYPERPGQPECKYFIKTGVCKFGSSCRFDHPKRRHLLLPYCSLSPTGLPQRPGVEPCPFYMQFGSCKFGSSCGFDHPSSSLAYSPLLKPFMNIPFLQYPLMQTFPKHSQSSINVGAWQQGDTGIKTGVDEDLASAPKTESLNAESSTST